MKKLTYAVLGSMLAFSLAVVPITGAQEVTSTKINEEATQQKNAEFGDGLITPQAVGNGTSETFVGNYASPIHTFNVASGYGHIKVEITNTSSYDITFSVQHVNSGKSYVTNQIVKPGKTFPWLSYNQNPQGVRGGDYNVQLRASGKGVSAKVYTVTGQYPSDVQ